MKHRSIIYVVIASSFIQTAKSLSTQLNQGPKQKHWLVVDFDSTCTERDTVSLLPKLASSFQNEDEIAQARRQEIWNGLELEYFTQYNEVKAYVLNNDVQMDLSTSLQLLDDVSTKVTRKVSSSNVLGGIPTSVEDMKTTIMNIDEAAEILQLRSGCVNTLSKAILAGWNFGVLSINWSEVLLDSVLLEPIREQVESSHTKNQFSHVLNGDNIWSNKVDENGIIDLIVPGAIDKQERLRTLRQKEYSNSPFIIYVGDSATDLLALLEADIGILIGQSQTTINFAKKWDIQLSPLSTLNKRVNADGSFKNRNIVWITSNWDDVNLLLSKMVDVKISNPNEL